MKLKVHIVVDYVDEFDSTPEEVKGDITEHFEEEMCLSKEAVQITVEEVK